MKSGEHIRISQCMIVKNEEKNIERALTWGKGIAAEQIVIDTGSLDRTAEIARRMGARVCHFSWVDDFSAAKNYAISKARYEWIVFLDADEYLNPEDGQKILNYVRELHDTSCQGLMTGLVDLDNDGNVMDVLVQLRVFRNLPILRYKGRIHERLTTTDGSFLKIADISEEVRIFHTGYSKAEWNEKRKDKRNLKLIQLELEECPDDYEMWGYLGNEYEALQDWGRAEQAYQKAVFLMPEAEVKGQYNITTSRCCYRFLELLISLGKSEEEILKLYQWAADNWPEDGDYDYITGKYYVVQGDCKKGREHVEKALKIFGQYGNILKSCALSKNLVATYELLAVCCYNNGELADCVKLTSQVLKESPFSMGILVILLWAFLKDMGDCADSADQIMGFLGRSFYNFEDLRDRIFVLQAAERAGSQALFQKVREMFTEEQLAVIDQKDTDSV